MKIKLILYIIVGIIVIWSMDSININQIFKKNRYYQARIIYMAIIFGLSYLVVNFLNDFVGVIKF